MSNLCIFICIVQFQPQSIFVSLNSIWLDLDDKKLMSITKKTFCRFHVEHPEKKKQ